MEGHRTIRNALHELADTRVIGIHQLVRSPLPQHLGVPHHIDVVGNAGGFREVVGNHDAGDAKGVVEQADQTHEHTHGNGVLADERLVVHQDLRIEGDGTGQRHATLHAAGQLIRHQLDGATQADGLELHQDNVTNHFLGEPGVHPEGESDVLEHIEIGEQRAALEQHAELLAHVEQVGAGEAGQVLAVDPDFATCRLELGRDKAQQRGLATTGRPHDAGDLAARDTNVDILENAARATFEGHPLQLDGIGVFGAHLDSLQYSLPERRRAPTEGHPAQDGPNKARTISPRHRASQGCSSVCSALRQHPRHWRVS
ncbi:hypothetical protein D9M71_87890 [compost metagenome]